MTQQELILLADILDTIEKCGYGGSNRALEKQHERKLRKLLKQKTVRCAKCGGPAILESAAEGYTCTKCGCSDSDE